MTKAMLIRRMIAVAAVVLLLVGGAVCGRLFGGAAGLEFYVIVTDFIELEIALIAVYIANVFQQRAFFVRGLRQLWSDIIVAKNDLITYTHNTTPDREQGRAGIRQGRYPALGRRSGAVYRDGRPASYPTVFR